MNSITLNQTFLNQFVGTPEHLAMIVSDSGLTKGELAELLTPEERRVFFDACAAIEKRYTVECTAANDPCLESGCAVEGEICLQPLLKDRAAYEKECAVEWAKVFADRQKSVR